MRSRPERIRLSRGRHACVHYEAGQPPWVASRLQDFFGMRETPAVARGAVPVVVRLLAPNQRPVQTTSDLAGFWQRLYPQVRKELARRYPKHAWPEDPLEVTSRSVIYSLSRNNMPHFCGSMHSVRTRLGYGEQDAGGREWRAPTHEEICAACLFFLGSAWMPGRLALGRLVSRRA